MPPPSGWSGRKVRGRDYSPALLRSLSLRLKLGLREIALSACGAFDLGINLPTDQESQSRNVQPDEQNHHRSQRCVSGCVRVEEMQVKTKSRRRGQPQERPKDGTRNPRVPVAPSQAWSAIINHPEGDNREQSGRHPLHRLPYDYHSGSQVELCADPVNNLSTRKQNEERSEKEDRDCNRQSQGSRANPKP